MTIQNTITEKLNQAFNPVHLEVINESDNHNVPPGSESHFKLVLVCDKFANQSLINRHRMVNEVLAEQLANDIHALAMHTYTPDEWQQRQDAPASPPCLGGGKAR